MLLTGIKIVDFKKIKGIHLPLSNVNVLVGVNSSGKSSIVQGVHLAATVLRQADRVDPNKTSTVGVDELDYLPTDDYSELGHGTPWGNRSGSPSTKVFFEFSEDEAEFLARCELRSARNAGISITGDIAPELRSSMRDKKNFFSAYIPGISGIPIKEEKRARKVVLKACSYGDSNVILRNVLALIKDDGKLETLEGWLAQIIGPIKINVEYKDDEDLYIFCGVQTSDTERPLELVGTGYLQLIQLFSYIILFSPKLLLVDEPDIHLHPSVQESLIRVLSQVAVDVKMRVLITTHSPFIVRAAPPHANVYWINDGAVEEGGRENVELALGWGAFGKKILLISEDTNTSLLRKLVAQWPEIDRLVAFYPGSGYKTLPSPMQAAEISSALGSKLKIVIHRDRDALTDEEISALSSKYQAEGAFLWVTAYTDVEAYFCTKEIVSKIGEVGIEDAFNMISDVIVRNIQPLKEQFTKQRGAINEEFYKHIGGSPSTEALWDGYETSHLRGGKGKFIFRQLKTKVPKNAFSEEVVARTELDEELAGDLKIMLEHVLTVSR